MYNSLKDRILESVDIVDVVGERVALKRKGRDYQGLCPFHNDHRPSLAVSPQKQLFKCWSCGVGGDVIKFVQLSQRVEFKEALVILAKRAGIELNDRSKQDHNAAQREQLRNVLNWARTYFQRNLASTEGGRAAADYARRRGITDETIKRFGIGYAPDAWDTLLSQARQLGLPQPILEQAGLISTNENNRTYDRFRNRLIFPINDTLGRCVAFGGRTLGNDSAKYLNSPETPLFSKSRILYGLDHARSAILAAREVVVVEGYTDAVLLHQYGITNVVATLGTALTDAHAKVLSRLSERIVMCFDGDDAGYRAADRAVETALRHRIEVVVVIMPAGVDPADFVIGHGAVAFKSLLQSAIGALEFKWNRTEEAFRGSGIRGQRDAIEAFIRFVARVTLAGGISDPVDHGQLVNRLANLISLPPGTVYELLAKTRAAVAKDSSDAASAIEEAPTYEAAIRDLPGGMISAVEELFGLALTNPGHFAELEEALSIGSQYCGPWRSLYEFVTDLVCRNGQYTKAEVIQCCEDAVLCDFVSRALRRVNPSGDRAELARVVARQLLDEVELLEMKQLRGSLRRGDRPRDAQAEAFEALWAAKKHRHEFLGPECHWRPGS